MKQYYNYVLHPQNDSHSVFTLDAPFSSNLYYTAKQAYEWAEMLLKYNTWADSVNFRSENGWKIYYVIRENGKFIRGKFD